MSEKWIKFRFGASGSSYGGLVNKCSDDFGQGKPFVTYMNVFSNCKTKDDCFEFVDIGLHEHQNVICQGDILFTTSSETPDEVGMSSVVTFDPKEPVYLNSFCFGFRFDESINLSPEFLAYLFRGSAVRNFMSTIAQGSTRYNLPKRYLFKDLYLTVPASISTQRHIGEVLGTCDEVIEQSERAAEKYRQIKAGMLKDLLTRGIDNRGKLRPPPSVAPELYKDSVLGPIPKEWEVKRLGDCGKFVAGNGFPLAYQGGLRGKYPFYKVSDFNRIGNERVMVMANNCINEDVAEMLHCSIIPKDAIVFAKIGAAIALERKRKVSSACCIDNNMMSFQVYNDYEVDFVLNHLQQQKFADLIEATALPALKTSVLKNILLPIPIDLAEQRAIAERLAAVDERIAAEMKTAEKYRKVKAGLMEKLLTPPPDAEIVDETNREAV